jgi:putative addiction module CopG family antidote
MTITLPQHIQSWIDQQVAEGRYESTDAVIASAVEQVMGPPYRWEEDQDLLDAIAEVDRGEAEEWTPELRDRIRRQSEEDARQGVPIPYDVTY